MAGNSLLPASQSNLRSKIVLPAAMLLSALAGYVLLLAFPPVLGITAALYEVKLWTAILLAALFWLVFRNQGRAWETLGLTLVLGLFAASLVYKWQTAYYDGNLIGGLLPWSDANDYFREAQRLIGGEHLTAWGTRRPLFTGFLAVLFFFTQRNLQVSLAVLVAVNAVAVYVAACEVRRTYGALSAAIFTSLCYLFCRTFAGKTLTENAGMAFGSLGMALLLRGARERQFRNACSGLFLLTIALNARAGAFFVLPVLIVWIGLIFRGSISVRKAVGTGILAVVLGFASNLIIIWTIGSPNGVPFSNYSYTFYGLASGNKGWAQVKADHPGVRRQDVARLALEKFREEPRQLVLGIARSYADYFKLQQGAFSFLKLAQPGPDVNASMWILTGFGLLVVMRFLKSPAYSFLLAGAAGIFASVSLVPPIDADSMRVYAATIPLSACLVSVGAAAPRHLLKWRRTEPQSAADPPGLSPLLIMPLSIGLLVSTVILPLIVFLLGDQKAVPAGGQCAPGQQRFATVAGSGSFVKLIADQDAEESYVPTVRVSDFKRGIGLGSLYPLLDQELLTLRGGQSIGVTSNSYVFAEPNPLNPGVQELCGTPPKNVWFQTYGFFYVDTGKQGPGSTASTMLSKHPQMTKIIRKSFGLGFVLAIFSAMIVCLGQVRLRAKTWIILAGGTALLIPGVLVYLHSSATLPLRWQRVPVPVKLASPEIGSCYILPLGVNWMSPAKGLPPAEIFEDGVPLRFPNAMHEDIRKKGEGRFSVWEGYLYLSTSDNTDPRTNGRRYEIYWPSPIAPPIRWLSYALSLGGGFTLVFLLVRKSRR